MKQASPLVTIAIPTRNRVALLLETIDSVLRQNYRHLDIVISDNASSDGTREAVQGLRDERIRYFRQDPDRGMVGNWNFCLEQARGEFFLLLSDDDLLVGHAIRLLLDRFGSPGVTLAYGRCRYIDVAGAVTGTSYAAPDMEPGETFVREVLRCRRVAFPSATLFKTLAARRLGGYPTEVGTATDFALHLQLAQGGAVAFSMAPVALYRVHPEALSASVSGVDSVVLLLDWAGKPGFSQKLFYKEFQAYAARYFINWGIRQACKGEAADVKRALRLLQTRTPGMGKEVMRCLLALPGRFFVNIIKKILLNSFVLRRAKP